MKKTADAKPANPEPANLNEPGPNNAHQNRGNAEPADTDKLSLQQLDRIMRRARSELGAEITIQRLLILVNVCLHEGLSQSELLQNLDSTSITALSRNLADLSAWTSRKQPGPGLLELRVDPMNLRRKTIHLTPKGRRLMKKLVRLAAPALKPA